MKEFLELVQKMRDAQKRYFRERSQAALVESKILERKVDLELERQKAGALVEALREQEELPG